MASADPGPSGAPVPGVSSSGVWPLAEAGKRRKWVRTFGSAWAPRSLAPVRVGTVSRKVRIARSVQRARPAGRPPRASWGRWELRQEEPWSAPESTTPPNWPLSANVTFWRCMAWVLVAFLVCAKRFRRRDWIFAVIGACRPTCAKPRRLQR